MHCALLLRLCDAAEDVDYLWPSWLVGSCPLTLLVSASSWFQGMEPDGGGLCQAAVPTGAVLEGGNAPAVHQQGARGHRAAALPQALQVCFPLSLWYYSVVIFKVPSFLRAG